MADSEQQNGSELDRKLSILERRGVPLVITGLVLLAFPYVAHRHLKTLDTQVEKLDSMDSSLTKLKNAEYPRPDFRAQVTQEHNEQLDLARRCENAHQAQAQCLERLADTLERVGNIIEAHYPPRLLQQKEP